MTFLLPPAALHAPPQRPTISCVINLWIRCGSLLREILTSSGVAAPDTHRSEEHTSELQSLMRISYAVFCLKKKKKKKKQNTTHNYHTKTILSQKNNTHSSNR